MLWNYFDAKQLLVTGPSGFLGTAIVYRIISRTSAGHLYLICRGGASRLRKQWSKWLPADLVQSMLDDRRVTVLNGDITHPNMGLSAADTEKLHETVNIIVHSASSINLVQRLSKISHVIVGASEMISTFALECKQLDRLAYISTAYVNAHLYRETDEIDVEIEEKFYPPSFCEGDAAAEWAGVRSLGSSLAYEAHDFPWAYAYAKHLTERLLTQRFREAGVAEKLFILRPSVIGPAQNFPFPAYAIPESSPVTMVIAGFALSPLVDCKFATRCRDPGDEATVDEVPVDVVVDRLMAHLANETGVPVHAVGGRRARWKFGELWRAVEEMRRPSGTSIRASWITPGWRSLDLHPLAQLFAIIGSSYAFSEGETCRLWERLSESDKMDLQLFAVPPSERSGWILQRRKLFELGMEVAKRNRGGKL